MGMQTTDRLRDALPAYEAFQKGLTAQQQGDLIRAIGHYRDAMDLGSLDAGLLNNFGCALRDLGRPEAAAEVLHLCARLYPDHAMCLSNLGSALADLGRREEALALCRKAALALPDSAIAWFNLGCVLQSLERDREAAACFERAIVLAPGYVEAHYNLAEARLRMGEFRAGWREFEWRGRIPKFRRVWSSVSRPFWQGEPLEGRRLLLNAEQGMGDMIQFARYASRIAAMEGEVILRVYPPLVRLMRGSLEKAVTVTSTADPKPDADFELMLMSAPLALEDRIDGIPGKVPYLSAPADEVETWGKRLVDLPGLRVGLVWAGGRRPYDPVAMRTDRKRSLLSRHLKALVGIPGVSWVSLQKGIPAEDLAQVPPDLGLHDFMAEIDDFAGTAALIEALDLVIAVDTAVAHLAGALGKPVWLLSRFNGCWRWLLDRPDSPWYPTLILYRQNSLGDWEEVLGRVARDLERLATPAISPAQRTG